MMLKEGYSLRLYVAGQTPRSIAAIANLKRICGQYLVGNYKIEIVDLMANPALAQRHQIVAIPTLVRQLPEPIQADHWRFIRGRKGSSRPRYSTELKGTPMAEVILSNIQPIEFEDAKEVIRAIHYGDVDALVVMKGTDPRSSHSLGLIY